MHIFSSSLFAYIICLMSFPIVMQCKSRVSETKTNSNLSQVQTSSIRFGAGVPQRFVNSQSGERMDLAAKFLQDFATPSNSPWIYTWGFSQGMLEFSDYVPMITGCEAEWDRSDLIQAHQDRPWMLYNEPDHPFQCQQSGADAASKYNVLREKYPAVQWHVGGTVVLPFVSDINRIPESDTRCRQVSQEMIDAAATNGTALEHFNGWWDSFLANVSAPKLQAIHIHAYAGWLPDNTYFTANSCLHITQCQNQQVIDPQVFSCLKKAIWAAHCYFQANEKTRDLPIWITETSPLSIYEILSDEEIYKYYMQPMLTWEQDASFPPPPTIKRIAWFSTHTNPSGGDNAYPDTNLYDANGSLSALGNLTSQLLNSQSPSVNNTKPECGSNDIFLPNIMR